jgi:uncharacterized protein YukJ
MNIDYVKLLNVKLPTLILPQGRKSNNQIKMLIGLNFECEVTHLNFPALPFGLRKYTFSSQGRRSNNQIKMLIGLNFECEVTHLNFPALPFGLRKYTFSSQRRKYNHLYINIRIKLKFLDFVYPLFLCV